MMWLCNLCKAIVGDQNARIFFFGINRKCLWWKIYGLLKILAAPSQFRIAPIQMHTQEFSKERITIL